MSIEEKFRQLAALMASAEPLSAAEALKEEQELAEVRERWAKLRAFDNV